MPMPVIGETSLYKVVASLRELWKMLQGTPALIATLQDDVAALQEGASAVSMSVNVQTFTASDTYTPTAGMVSCIIRVQAPGGGSGGADGSGGGGEGTATGGGGAGEYAEGIFTAEDIGEGQTVTIGSPGTAGNTTGGNAGNGGTTSVGSLISANGGTGSVGTGSNSTSPAVRAGGAGGTGGSGGYLRIPGGKGGNSEVVTDEATFGLIRSGKGGDAHLGFGPWPTDGFDDGTARAGTAGANYGAGASGARSASTSGVAGAAGGPGIVIIEEFIVS